VKLNDTPILNAGHQAGTSANNALYVLGIDKTGTELTELITILVMILLERANGICQSTVNTNLSLSLKAYSFSTNCMSICLFVCANQKLLSRDKKSNYTAFRILNMNV